MSEYINCITSFINIAVGWSIYGQLWHMDNKGE